MTYESRNPFRDTHIDWSPIIYRSTTQPTWAPGNTGPIVSRSVPVATFENDIYVAWRTNKTGNDEVIYRVSSDAGKTFTDKINLSNSPNSDSTDLEISADEGKVAIT
jgi:hypothetical protein